MVRSKVIGDVCLPLRLSPLLSSQFFFTSTHQNFETIALIVLCLKVRLVKLMSYLYVFAYAS